MAQLLTNVYWHRDVKNSSFFCAATREREGISEEYARSRVNAQKPDEFYRENSHHVLENDGSLSPDEFYRAAYEYFKSIL